MVAMRESEQFVELPDVVNLTKHEWVWDVQDVSVSHTRKVIVVRTTQQVVPQFILESDAFTILEAWIDTIPGLWRYVIGTERARRYGLGKSGITVMIEIE